MPRKHIPQRTRFFFAVEGEGEQAFVKWMNKLSDQNGLHITLDCQPLGGGGYKSMLEKANRYREKKDRKKAKATILLIDADRSVRDDGWTIQQLKEEAAKKKPKIHVCVQHPNQEGLLLRMFPKNECIQPQATTVQKQLNTIWREYKKPIDANTLSVKFTLEDLRRVAKVDGELKCLLQMIGLF